MEDTGYTEVKAKTFNSYIKPPLGASPAYITAERRIKELADAISRTSEAGRNYTGTITMWANEIIAQCRIINDFNQYSE